MAGIVRESELIVDNGGGGGGTDVTIIAPLPLPITGNVTIVNPIGPNTQADSVSVTLATDEDPIDIIGPLTDAELRATPVPISGTISVNEPVDVEITAPLGSQLAADSVSVAIASDQLPLTVEVDETYVTTTGSITGNGQSVTLSLLGRKSAAVKFNVPVSFSGSVRFYTSHDNGTLFVECQAVRPFVYNIVNVGLTAWDGSNSVWVFCLTGGETHVRVTSVSFSSGQTDLTLTGSPAPTDSLLNAISSTGDVAKPLGHIVIAGARSTGSYAIEANNSESGLDAIGLVVRNIGAVGVDGSSANAITQRSLVAGTDPDDNTIRTLQLDTEAPTGSEAGLIVRNIPSGTQPISGTVNIGTFPDNEPFNVAQVAGTATSVNVGAADAGTIRTASLIHDGTDIALVSSAGALATGSVATVTTGSITAVGQSVSAATNEASGILMDITNSWVGSLEFEGSSDEGTTWTFAYFYSWNSLSQKSGGTEISLLLGGKFERPTGGLTNVRVRASAWTSGQADIRFRMISAAPFPLQLPFGGGSSATAIRVTPSGTGSVNLLQVNSNTVNTGAGASAGGTQRVAVAIDAITANAPAAVTVGVASGLVLASNASRKSAHFQNTSVNIISLAESGQTAVLNSGITLFPGGTYDLVPPFLTTGQINGIASAVSSNISILEKQ